VLIARLDNVGDVLLAGPAVRAVASSGAQVTFACGPRGRAAADLLPGITDIIELDAPWVPLEPADFDRDALVAFSTDVARRRIDEAAILTSFHQSPLPLALLLRLAGVRRIAATSVDHAGSLVDVRLRDLGDRHEVLRALELVGSLGYRLPSGDDGRLRLLGGLPDWRPVQLPYVVVHPGASVAARGIPGPLAAEAVRCLSDRGWTVAVTGSAVERPLTRVVAGARAFDLGGALDLAGLAGLLAKASVLVAGNTGAAHLAAAVGTPVASVFAPVVPSTRWRPYGVPVALLGEQNVPCAGCRARSCPLPDQPCIAELSGATIADAVDRLAARVHAKSVPA
jgi:ADP-heptose:LPS heptosyltransferase